MSKSTSEHDHESLLSREKLLGENLGERLSRFGQIVENAHGNWDLSDRDENAIRTANALLREMLEALEGAVHWLEAELAYRLDVDAEIAERDGLSSDYEPEYTIILRADLGAVKATIAKAKGESK